MATYKCFFCGKETTNKVLKKSGAKSMRCPNCNSRIFFKPRHEPTRVKAV